jgi:hypothetical protein
MARRAPSDKAAAVDRGNPPSERAIDQLAVVLEFDSVEEYHAMGADISAARSKLGLPTWSTPMEVIAAALQNAL